MMNNDKPQILKIDKHFKSLIRPLRKQEYKQLELNILQDGCREAIITWNGFIVDGHNRYEICHKHGIPFQVREMYFESREDVIAWICANQLGRRNISEETRHFLIGMQYETQKLLAGRKKKSGENPYDDVVPTNEDPRHRHVTAVRIAEENNVSFGTVQKYAIYSRAMTVIQKKNPAFASLVLSGRCKISHNNILEISKLPSAEIEELRQRLEKKNQAFLPFSDARLVIQENFENAISSTDQPSVKDMPQFDPDASVTELTLTMPSWLGSIKRAKEHSNFSIVSDAAKSKLTTLLNEFQKVIADMISTIQEDSTDD